MATWTELLVLVDAQIERVLGTAQSVSTGDGQSHTFPDLEKLMRQRERILAQIAREGRRGRISIRGASVY